MSGCAHCGGHKVDTVDSRHFPNMPWRMRRKRCASCGARWSTYEVPIETLDGIMDFRRQVTAMKETITNLDHILNNVPIIKDTCDGESSRTGMGKAA